MKVSYNLLPRTSTCFHKSWLNLLRKFLLQDQIGLRGVYWNQANRGPSERARCCLGFKKSPLTTNKGKLSSRTYRSLIGSLKFLKRASNVTEDMADQLSQLQLTSFQQAPRIQRQSLWSTFILNKIYLDTITIVNHIGLKSHNKINNFRNVKVQMAQWIQRNQ